MKRRFLLVLALLSPLLPLTSSSMADTSTTTVPAPARPTVMYGIDVLAQDGFAALKGKQVGLITNQTGVTASGRSTADVLYHAPGVKLIALFSPEHGIRGTREHGQVVGDTFDSKTKLPVYSLYGKNQRPTAEMLNAIDVLVFDMQDVGARFYTYLTTMALGMEAAAARHIEFVVLDRPNPAGGDVVEGQVLDWRIRHFTAYFSIPVRHGFTAGELAQWYNKTGNIKAKLTVIPMKNWSRDMLWRDTGLRFVRPSPNIRTPEAALVYSGIGIFEATNLAVGRGTERPFGYVGAPWVKGAELAEALKGLQLPGVEFSSATFTPTKDLYVNQPCSGVRIEVTDPKAARPVDWFVHIACLLRQQSKKDFVLRWDEVARVTGSHDFERLYGSGQSASKILELFHKSADSFKDDRKPYLLY